MRRLAPFVAAALLAVSPPTPAGAVPLVWSGTLEIDYRSLGNLSFAGSETAEVNLVSGTLGHLTTLLVTGGIAGTSTLIDPSPPASDPVFGSPVVSVTAMAALGGAVFFPISGGGPLSLDTLPVPGNLKVCLLLAGCNTFLSLPLTRASSAGVGLGGIVTVNGFGAGLRLSLVGAPWTIGTAMLTGVVTSATGTPPFTTTTRTAAGFAHGPVSGSSTANTGGVLQVVTPILVQSNLGPTMGMFGRLRIEFVPEPARLVLLAAGVLGLAALARRRR